MYAATFVDTMSLVFLQVLEVLFESWPDMG